MLYCENCGQCSYISDDSFIEYRQTFGWEKNYIDPENGDHVEYGDSETSDTEHDYYECPYCNNSNIEFESRASEVEALDLRNNYEQGQSTARYNYAQQLKEEELKHAANDPNREWDVEKNV